MALIISNWPQAFKERFGGKLPDDYLAIDLETSGFSRQDDVIVEWGHCLVRNRQPVDRLSIILNWYASDVIPADWLTQKLHRIAMEMRAENRSWHITPERMRAEGIAPKRALKFMHELLCTAHAQKLMLVSHNGWKFDAEMLTSSFAQDLQQDFRIAPDGMLDTGAIVKASQCDDPATAMPRAGETLKAYFTRIANARMPGIKWNLDSFCLKAFKLAETHGLDPNAMHAAGQDAYVLHLLMEKLRAIDASADPWQWWTAEAEKTFHALNPPPGPMRSGTPAVRRRQRNR